MRVLHVIPSLARAHGGPTVALESMERVLTARGVLVTTVTTDDNGPGQRNWRSCGDVFVENGVSRHYFAKRTEFYKVAPSLGRWLRRRVAEYDLVHVHALFSYASVVACRAARQANVPYVVRPLGTLARYGLTQRHPWLKKVSLRYIEGPLLQHAAAVHFTSDTERVEAGALGIQMKPVVIPLGVETPPLGKADCLLAELPPLGADLRVVFLSRLDPKKNLEGLIGAIGLLHRAGMPVTVLVGGSGEPDYVARLQALATTEGVGSRIHWLGPVSGNRKADLLAAGEVFILPSFSENFGIAAVEALAIGLPCVLGRGVAIAAEVEAAGAGVSVAPDPEAIAAALRLCICDKAWRNSASVLGRQLAEREYSVDRMGERLVQLYRRVSPHG